MSSVSEKLKLVSLLLVVWVSISSASIIVVLSSATPEACAFWRLLFSIPLLWVLGSLGRDGWCFTRVGIHHIFSGLALALHFVLWMHSLFLVPIYVSTLLVTMYPLYSLFIEATVLRRKVKATQVLGFFICTFLLALYLGVSELVFNIGAIEALIAGVLAALYFEIGSYARYRLKEATIGYAINTYLFASIFVLLAAFINGAQVFYIELNKYLYFVLLAAIPMILGHTLMNYMLGKYPASIVTSVSYGESFGAGLLAYILIGQTIGVSHILFGLAILTTVFITVTYLNKT